MKAYAPHAAYVAPAVRSSGLVHTVVGFCAIEFFYRLGTEAAFFLFDSLAEMTGSPALEPGSRPEVLFNLATYGILAVAVVFVVWMTHHRGPRSLFGDVARLWSDFRGATLAALTVFLLIEVISPVWYGTEAKPAPFWPWLLYLPWALVAILVQVVSEELLYRGYLQQQIAARYQSPLAWLIIPNVIFATVHWSNGVDTIDSVQYVIWAFVFGLAASDLVARTGSLGAAIGLHFVNNIFAFVVIGSVDDLDSALALYLLPPVFDMPDAPPLELDPAMVAYFGVDLGIILLVWLAIRIAVRR